MLCITLAEFLDPSGGINKLLFTGKERMTGRADFNFEFGQNTANFNFVSTGANGHDGLVVGMYIVFHMYPTASRKLP